LAIAGWKMCASMSRAIAKSRLTAAAAPVAHPQLEVAVAGVGLVQRSIAGHHDHEVAMQGIHHGKGAEAGDRKASSRAECICGPVPSLWPCDACRCDSTVGGVRVDVFWCRVLG
jgi:hypothetical protein